MPERRAEAREPMLADLWMSDPVGGALLRCRCLNRSARGMGLRIPLGYGVHPGQRYELCSHPPGRRRPEFGLMVRRRASVRWRRIVLDGGKDHLHAGVLLDPDQTVVSGPLRPPAA